MSGRKASEVSSLLSRGAEARRAGQTNFNSITSSSKSNIEKKEKEIKSIVDDIKNINLNISSDAKNEFSEEAKQLGDDLESIKKKAILKGYDVNFIDSGIKEVTSKLKRADNESAELRNIIRAKPHYCDPEYARADKLVKEYRDINRLQNSIKDKANRLSNEIDVDLSNTKALLSQAKGIEKNIQELNKKAIEVVNLRKEANKAKDFIVSMVSDIDSSIANKFMKNEYEEVVKLKDKLLNSEDKYVIENINNISEKISIFKNNLQKIHEEFEAKKSEAEQTLKSVEESILKNKFYNPMEFIKNDKEAKQIELFTFLNIYVKGQFVNEIEEGINNAQDLINKENFEGANDISKSTMELIEKAVNYATVKQENILKNAYIALDIRNVMRNMNYKTNASIIDNDITNGFRITCEVGDELIDFDKVFVDDDGKPTIDIDHTESVSGTCANKWPAIQQGLADAGIFVKDITKNGVSVIDKNRKIENHHVRETRNN